MTLPALIVPTLLGATAKTSSGSSEFLLLAIIAVAFYLIAIRPQRQRAKKQRALVSQFEVGQEVLTAGGLVGRIIEIDGDRMTLETSVGASFVVLRSYVIRRLDADPAATGSGADASTDEDGSGEHGGGYAIGGAAIGGRARRGGATRRDEVDTDEDDEDGEDEDGEDEDGEDGEDDVGTGGIDAEDGEDDGEEADDPGQPGHVNG